MSLPQPRTLSVVACKLGALSLWALGTATATPARADLAWSVPASCGDEASLLSELSRLGTGGYPLARLEALSVDIHPASDTIFELILHFQVAQEPHQTRTLRDPNCGALVRAAALTLSLALRAIPVHPVVSAPTPPLAVVQSADRETIPALKDNGPTRKTRRVALWLAADPTLLIGVLPAPGFGAGLSLRAHVRSLRIDSGGAYVGPRHGNETRTSQLSANLVSGHVGFGIEAWRLPWAALVFQSQARLGWMGAAGRKLEDATTARALFATAGAGLLAEVQLRPRVSAGLFTALQYALMRARFELSGGELVYATPRWSALLQFSLSARFL